jgi:hypothetical protein
MKRAKRKPLVRPRVAWVINPTTRVKSSARSFSRPRAKAEQLRKTDE